MRRLIAWLLIVGTAGFAAAADDKKSDDEKKPSLKVGDAPPPIDATKWLQGKEVTSFEPGKVYVVEFWATWCGPCIAIMPHVASLQREFRDAGVTVIGFTAKDPNNTAEKVAEFVTKRGPKLGYTFAFADNRNTYDAYMKAAGQNGIPCAFVIGKDGKLAYIGHPVFLDEVLPKVVAGTWDAAAGAEEIAKIDQQFDKVFSAINGEDIEGGLKALAEFEAQRPRLAKSVYLVAPKLNLLMRAKKFEQARAMAERAIAEAAEQDDTFLLRQVSSVLRSPPAQGEKAFAALAVSAAEANLKLAGDKDLSALLNLADALKSSGNATQAVEVGRKAIAVAEAAVNAEGEKKNPMTLIRLADAYLAAGEADKAKDAAQKALDAAPANMKRNFQRMVEKYGVKPKDDGDK